MKGYQGGAAQWAWVLHRVTGVGILLFLFIHILDTTLIIFGPTLYNHAMNLYASPFFRPLEVVLYACVLYHALNGVRITFIDLWDWAATFHRALLYGELVLFIVLFLPGAYLMVRPLFQ